MEVLAFAVALAALAAMILTLVAPPADRRRRTRNDGTCGDDAGWSPAMFGDGGGSDCGYGDAGGDCGGGDGGGD